MEQAVISSQRTLLINHVRVLLAESEPHSIAFVLRVLGDQYVSELPYENLMNTLSGDVVYEGFPRVASLGYMLGIRDSILHSQASLFITGASRLATRSEAGLKVLAADEVAILGIASGLATLKKHGLENIDSAQNWLIEIINHPPRAKLWSYRMRDLAGDLLDGKGRLRVSVDENNLDTEALEVVLRDAWPEGYKQVSTPIDNDYRQLLQKLMLVGPEKGDEIEKVTVWLKALDLTVQYLTAATLPDYDRTALSNLEAVKNSLDRKAIKSVRRKLWISLIMLLLAYGAIVASIYYLTWDVMEQWTYIIGLLPVICVYSYFVITLRELTPTNMYERLVQRQKQRLYKEVGFELAIYEKAKSIADIRKP